MNEIEIENGIEIATGSGSGPEKGSGSGSTVQPQVCSIGGYQDLIQGFAVRVQGLLKKMYFKLHMQLYILRGQGPAFVFSL